MFRSLQIKLITILSLVVIVLVVSIGSISITSINKSVEEDTYTILEKTAESEKDKINITLSSIEQSVDLMSDIALQKFDSLEILNNETKFQQYNEEIAETFINVSYNTKSVLTLFYRYNIDLCGPTAGFWYGLENGIMKSRPTTNLSLYDKYDIQNSAWYFIPYESAKACWIEPYYHSSLDLYVISYVAPIYYSGVFIGVIGMEIDLSILTNMVDEADVFDQGFGYLVNKYNQIVHHPTASFKDDRPTLTNNIIEVEKNLSNGMTLILQADIEKVNLRANKSKTTILISSSIISIVCLAFVCYYLFNSLKPLKELTKSTNKASAGDFDIDVSYYSGNNLNEVQELSNNIFALVGELKDKNEYVNKLAFVDSLTGVYNKTAYLDHALRMNKNLKNRKFAVVSMELLELVSVNEQYGREIGNELLLSATQFISQTFDKSNVYRISGGVFAVILEGSEYERKEYLFKKFIEDIKDLYIVLEQEEKNIFIAIGMYEFNEKRDSSFEAVAEHATKIMQTNKEHKKKIINHEW